MRVRAAVTGAIAATLAVKTRTFRPQCRSRYHLGEDAMYTERARQMRLCRGVTKRGTACQQFAMWDHEEQLCVQHAGLGHHGPQQRRDRWLDPWSPPKRHRRPQVV